MKKTFVSMLAVISMIAFGYMGPVYAQGRTDMNQPQTQTRSDRDMNKSNMNRTEKMDKSAKMERSSMMESQLSDWNGKEVKNANGDDLGKIKDFVMDSRGRIEFAILSTGAISGKTIAVPFHALHWNQQADRQYFTLNMTKDQLDKAPEYNKSDLNNRTWAQNVYRYFGMQSRWSEEGKAPKTSEHGQMNRSSQSGMQGNQYGTTTTK